jgi:hypothetical protein
MISIFFKCSGRTKRLISCVPELPSFCADNWQHTNQRQWAGTGHDWVRNVMADSGRWDFEMTYADITSG